MKPLFDSLFANVVGKRFLHHFTAEVQMAVPGRCDEIVARTRTGAQELFRCDQDTCPDAQAQVILGMCCLTLAGYQALLEEINSSQNAYLIVKATVGRLYRGLGTFAFRPLLWLSNDPVKQISKINWTKWNQLIYGKGMEFDQDVTSDKATLIVNRCAFHHFFTEKGEPHLTQAFCAWDRVWMDVIDDSSRPIRTERPTTISTGSNCCQFQCVRDTAKAKKPRNDVILEQQDLGK